MVEVKAEGAPGAQAGVNSPDGELLVLNGSTFKEIKAIPVGVDPTGMAFVTVTRDGYTNLTSTVDYTTSNGTALTGHDYQSSAAP